MAEQDLLQELRLDAADRNAPSRRRWGWVVALLISLAAVAAGGYYLVLDQALAVDTAIAEAPDTESGAMAILEATGYVTARREATVSAKITGKLAEVLIEEGEHVTAGQVLARLDDVDAKAQLGLVRARLAAVRAQLGQTEAQLEQAQRDLKRQQELRSRKLNSEEALENARTQVRSLTAQLEAQRGQVRVSEAELRVAEVDHDNTIVRAPFSGVVVAKTAQPGEIVSPISAGGGFTRTGIGTIVDMDSLEIEVDVNEAFINRVRPDQPVRAVLDAYPDWKLPAHVIAIVPTADRSKATVKVRIALDEKDPRIVPEMGVRVSFLEDRPRNRANPRGGALVPSSAIVERDGQTVVFVVEGERARRREVTAGQGVGALRVVEGALAPGATVVRDPPPGLTDGMRVAVPKPAS